MNNEEQRDEPEPEVRRKYAEGLRRIWIVFTVAWVAFWVIVPLAVILQSGPRPLIYRERQHRSWFFCVGLDAAGVGVCVSA